MSTHLHNNKIMVENGHYFDSYETLPRWIIHWYQIDKILSLKRNKVLEVGPGNGIVSRYLRLCGLCVRTVDIDNRNSPDILADVINLPIESESFDIVSCCEVLEHMPYDKFNLALTEIYRVTSAFAIISIPAPFAGAAFSINLPKTPIFKFHLGMPLFVNKKFDGEHYWELGRWGYPLKRIRRDIESTGFEILHEKRPALSLFCYFFLLQKPVIAKNGKNK